MTKCTPTVKFWLCHAFHSATPQFFYIDVACGGNATTRKHRGPLSRTCFPSRSLLFHAVFYCTTKSDCRCMQKPANFSRVNKLDHPARYLPWYEQYSMHIIRKHKRTCVHRSWLCTHYNSKVNLEYCLPSRSLLFHAVFYCTKKSDCHCMQKPANFSHVNKLDHPAGYLPWYEQY